MDTKEDIRQKTIDLLKLIAQGEEDVRAGNLTDQEALFDRIETRLKAKKTDEQAIK
ncbi:MAG TPA: hypothetical protein VEP69_03500 [Thermodesulfovibrionales bacterium]|nr:hypothetical protein [Thermodesulfovibrionales bacterium]